ncbi:MAG: hypothetical protein HC915_20785 [Anaerolineae bacterium]|nr:hypothetical protein [Anaerolineae bacterium]
MNWRSTLHHDGSAPYVSDLYPRLGDLVMLRLRAAASAPIRRVLLHTMPNGEKSLAVMQPEPGDGPVRWWRTLLGINELVVHYRFLLETDAGIVWLTAAAAVQHEPADATDFRILADYQPPAWIFDRVFYQVFPDVFHNGDPALNIPSDAYTVAGQAPRQLGWEQTRPADWHYSHSYYGGDLPGILQKLDYLERLGVNALFLNPIFTAYTVHKYDTANYDQVDPYLGGDAALADLAAGLHARGMRLMLDIVPNHCGTEHAWFRAAQADPNGPEAEFFYFHDHPHDYEGWLVFKNLVKLDYSIPWQLALQQFNLLDSHDTPRLRTQLGGNGALQRLAVLLLLTFPGVPCLYYGDEVGLGDVGIGPTAGGASRGAWCGMKRAGTRTCWLSTRPPSPCARLPLRCTAAAFSGCMAKPTFLLSSASWARRACW